LLSWLQHQRIFALALWGSAFIIAAIATVLIVVARDTVPDFWSIVIGNAILAAAYGLIWSGARNFEGKRVSIVLTLAGALVWLAACSIGPIYARPEARATVMAAIAITYALLTVGELWRGRGDGLWRWPIMLLLLVHAAAVPIRIALVGSLVGHYPIHPELLTFALFEALFLCICAAYLFVSLVKDRIASRHQNVSLIDPLTGVSNRRGFLEAGERLMTRNRFANRPAALLTFDLDRFKSINDNTGILSVTRCSSHFVGWRLRRCGRRICSAEWEVKSSRACCRIRRGKTPSNWQSGCVSRSKPSATRSQNNRLPRQLVLASQPRTMRVLISPPC
jgi:predicted signal transduction protein with EAL and GGDEF domain